MEGEGKTQSPEVFSRLLHEFRVVWGIVLWGIPPLFSRQISDFIIAVNTQPVLTHTTSHFFLQLSSELRGGSTKVMFVNSEVKVIGLLNIS